MGREETTRSLQRINGECPVILVNLQLISLQHASGSTASEMCRGPSFNFAHGQILPVARASETSSFYGTVCTTTLLLAFNGMPVAYGGGR